MHHVHISTGFMFVLVVLVLGLVGALITYLLIRQSQRNDAKRQEAQDRYYRDMREYREKMRMAAPNEAIPLPSLPRGVWPSQDDPRAPSSPAPSSGSWGSAPSPQVVYAAGAPHSGNDMMTGVLLGSVISNAGHHDTAVIHESSPARHTPSYSTPSDDGFSYSDSGSSDGSSGGFDFGF